MFRVIAAVALACAVTFASTTNPLKLNTAALPWFYVTAPSMKSVEAHPLFAAEIPKPVIANEAPDEWAARAQYNASSYDLGWDWFRAQASDSLLTNNRSWGYYYAGYAEGFLTQRMISYNAPQLIISGLSPKVQQWIMDHIEYIKTNVAQKASTDVFWEQIGDILSQIRGITDGYNAATGGEAVPFEAFFVMSFGPEVGDVMVAVSLKEFLARQSISNIKIADIKKHLKPQVDRLRKTHPSTFHRLQQGSHCSAMVRPTAHNLFMAHDTWSGYGGFAWRIFKRYDFQTTVTMSGYPGSIVSGDDWYMTSNELAVQETTNEVFNTSLYVNVVPQTVSEFLRVMTANYIAIDGATWTANFSRDNSGTYNNQYMVVDFKVFAPGKPLEDGTLWIAEQLPGLVAVGDVTDVLRTQGYWGSYNIPYFTDIYQISGYTQMEQEQGTFWSYTKYARPMIFSRNHTDVVDVPSLMRMMRYNDWRVDPLSIIPNCKGAVNNTCNPTHSSMLTIASRGDLLPVFATDAENIAHYGPLYQLVAQGCFGAIDSKIASWEDRKTLAGFAINGPTSDQQPVFQWNTGSCSGSFAPTNNPTVVNFPWLRFES